MLALLCLHNESVLLDRSNIKAGSICRSLHSGSLLRASEAIIGSNIESSSGSGQSRRAGSTLSLLLDITIDTRHVGLVVSSGTARAGLLSTRHQVIHPIVLERVGVRVESLWLRDHLNFLVVVGSTAVCGDDCPLEVGMLEVSAGVVDRLLSLSPRLTLARLSLHHGGSSVAHLSLGLSSSATHGLVQLRSSLIELVL